MILTIKKGDFIKINYNGKVDEGIVFVTTDESVAKEHDIFNPDIGYGGDVITVGAKHVLLNFDEDLIGKEVGYIGTVTVPVENAFGEHKPELIESFPISKFKDQELYKGAKVTVDNKTGVVRDKIGRKLRIDFNHPFAGKDITYEYTIEEKIEEDSEKIKGLFTSYVGGSYVESISIEDKKATITISKVLSYKQKWLYLKQVIASNIFENMDIDSVNYVETYSNDSEKEESTSICGEEGCGCMEDHDAKSENTIETN